MSVLRIVNIASRDVGRPTRELPDVVIEDQRKSEKTTDMCKKKEGGVTTFQ